MINQTQKLLCDLCSYLLFDKQITLPNDFNIDELIDEAKKHTVFPMVITALKKLSVNTFKYETEYFACIARNVRVNYAHGEICSMMRDSDIRAIILKGTSSADYYKEPSLRVMGDVDILIKESDIEKANEILLKHGFLTDDDIFNVDNHCSYKKDENGLQTVCEVHLKVNGAPNHLKEVFDEYLTDIFEKTKQIDVGGTKCTVPGDFHHGIVILLHTAGHLTNEGIGLRHFCDWAVFVNSFNDKDFVNMFEVPLKKMGLWRFTKLLTLCCTEYLGVAPKEWTGSADIELLEKIMSDMLNGGNFGTKENDRHSQVKYLKNRETSKVSNKNRFTQILSIINEKAHTEYGFVKKCKLLLPIGWLAVLVKYLWLLLKGERKIDSMDTVNNANKRKNIYKEFKLFE